MEKKHWKIYLEKILTLLHLVISILLIQKEKALISLVYIEKK